MKIIKNPFLFFISLIGFLCYDYNHAQKVTNNDSLTYYYYLAMNPKKNSDLPLAHQFYNTLKEKSLLENDTLNTVYALRLIASIEKELGYFYESELSATEALKLLDNFSIKESTIEPKLGLLNHLGIIYKLLYNYDKALGFYNNALKIAQKTEDSITILNNKANVYIYQKKYDLAIEDLKKAYLKSKKNNNIQTALVLDNLGYVKSKLNLPDALQNIQEALDIREKQKNLKGIYTSYRTLTKFYNENNNPEKSKYYANSAYHLAKQINSVSYIEDALSNLVALNKDSTIIEYKELKDSITKAKELSRNAYSFNKYNYEKQEKALLKTQFKRERDRIIYLSVAFFIVLISLFAYLFITSKHKKDKLHEVYTTETRISKKLHDELANDVYNVINRIQNNASENQETVLNQLDDIYKRTRDISHENSSINLSNTYYHLELKDMLNAYQNQHTSISIIGMKKEILKDIEDHKKIVLERVLKELMTNMKKHSNASNVLISFKKHKKNIYVTYTDDGVGLKKTEHFKSNGLLNAENRIKNINGSFNFDTTKEKGVVIQISFPV